MLFESKRNADARQEMKLRTAASALIVVAALVFGGGLFMMGAHASGLIKTTGAYTTTRLVPGTYSNTIECNGSVMPIRVTDVDTKAKGSVTVVHVRDGQYVKQGTVLFEMRDGQDEPQVITASVAGTVTNLKVAVGMTSDQLAQQGPALQIADMNVLIGVVQTPEYVSVLARSRPIREHYLDGNAWRALPGHAHGFSKNPSSSSLTSSGQALYDASIMFDNSGALKVGDPIVAQMHIEDYGQVFYVPATAVREIDDVAYVDIVRANGTVEQHQVELLGTSDDGSKIVKGDILTSETVIRADLNE